MPTDDVFKGREKQIVIRTREEVLAQIMEHRRAAHGVSDMVDFFDCAVCGLLEARLRKALDTDAKDPS